ncbi:MAG: hypothetical protein R3199_00510 [Gemmatimonadota bacterium]|nr:hypothetical protein [Gemmatimonadota bacterium]
MRVPRFLPVIALSLAMVAGATASARAQGPEERSSDVPIPSLLEPATLLSVGWIVDPDAIRDRARVLGSEKEGDIEERSLTVFDRLFVPPVVAGTAIDPGDLVLFYRPGETVVDPETDAVWGQLLLPTGVGRVEELVAEVARVTVTEAFAPVEIGQGVRTIAPSDTLVTPDPDGPADADGYVLLYRPEKAVHPPYDVAFLRVESGVLAPGATIRLFREGKTRRGYRLPPVELGRAMVVRAEGEIATAVLTSVERSDLRRGDRFREVEEER